jgi:hypothetical protein
MITKTPTATSEYDEKRFFVAPDAGKKIINYSSYRHTLGSQYLKPKE